MSKDLLLIFVRTPEAGKVKTRLAATIGEQKALQVYQLLLQRTHAVTTTLACDKKVCYTPYIEQNDLWSEGGFQKDLQAKGGLGERMLQAFQQGFAAGYQRICIIGSDCYQLTTALLEQAFAHLREYDVVAGPSEDGGYYLLGMTQLHKALFRDKQWSTSSVMQDTLADIHQAELSYALLPVLTDVDEEKDLKTMQ